jgi:hypothetical protein
VRPRTRRQLTVVLAVMAGLFVLGAAALFVLYQRVPFVREAVGVVFPRHRGELVATVGMPLAEMHARSSLPISAGFTYDGSTSGVFEPFFDWQVAETPLRFRRCRFGGYGTDKSARIDHLEVSVSPRRLRWREMVEELRGTRDQLTAAGFSPDTQGHTMSDERLLAQWLAREPPAVDIAATDAFTWRKDGLEVLFFAEQQERGRWVQRVSLARADATP